MSVFSHGWLDSVTYLTSVASRISQSWPKVRKVVRKSRQYLQPNRICHSSHRWPSRNKNFSWSSTHTIPFNFSVKMYWVSPASPQFQWDLARFFKLEFASSLCACYKNKTIHHCAHCGSLKTLCVLNINRPNYKHKLWALKGTSTDVVSCLWAWRRYCVLDLN